VRRGEDLGGKLRVCAKVLHFLSTLICKDRTWSSHSQTKAESSRLSKAEHQAGTTYTTLRYFIRETDSLSFGVFPRGIVCISVPGWLVPRSIPPLLPANPPPLPATGPHFSPKRPSHIWAFEFADD
jgi:hypothetical protein